MKGYIGFEMELVAARQSREGERRDQLAADLAATYAGRLADSQGSGRGQVENETANVLDRIAHLFAKPTSS